MQRTPLFTLITVALAATLSMAAQAAELGDIAVRSFIGQPLSADIELVSLAPDEVSALQVRLAQADVFRGANITMNPALSTVHITVVKRDQKQFLHVTTTRPVETDYVHLYLELSAAGRQDVRLATVWLQADPNPAPPPAVASAPVPAMTAEAARIAAQTRMGTSGKPADAAPVAAAAAATTAAATTAAAATERDRTRPAPLPSAHESEVGTPGALKAAGPAAPARRPAASSAAASAVHDLPERIADAMGAAHPAHPAKSPAAKPAEARSAEAKTAAAQSAETKPPADGKLVDAKSAEGKPADARPTDAKLGAAKHAALKAAVGQDAGSADGMVPLTVAQALLPLPPLPLPKGVKRPAAPPVSCTPTGMSAKECAVLDTHSVALTSKLVELENKVKELQGALNGAAAVKVAGPVPAGPHPAASASASGPGASASANRTSASASANGPGAVASASAAGASVGAHAAAALAAANAAEAGVHGEAGASASASVEAAAPVKKVRVLPKLKYKKEKPVEKEGGMTTYLAAGAAALALLAAGGYLYLRRKRGSGPLKIWQGFRKKKPAETAAAPAETSAEPAEEAAPIHKVTPESLQPQV